MDLAPGHEVAAYGSTIMISQRDVQMRSPFGQRSDERSNFKTFVKLLDSHFIRQAQPRLFEATDAGNNKPRFDSVGFRKGEQLVFEVLMRAESYGLESHNGRGSLVIFNFYAQPGS
jgi:hypothetical protein